MIALWTDHTLRRRTFWIGGLWVAAGIVFLVQALMLATLLDSSQEQALFGGVQRSFRWRMFGMFAPLFLVTAAFILKVRWLRGSWQSAARWGRAALVPAYPVAWLAAVLGGGMPIERVQLASGHTFILAREPTIDAIFTLYEPVGILGLHWRPVSPVGYPDNVAPYGGPRLVLSPDEKWLLVEAGGSWANCFRLDGSEAVDCDVTVPYVSSTSDEAYMRLRSRRIAQLTHLIP